MPAGKTTFAIILLNSASLRSMGESEPAVHLWVFRKSYMTCTDKDAAQEPFIREARLGLGVSFYEPQ